MGQKRDKGSTRKRKFCDLAAGELCQKDWLRRRRHAAGQIAAAVPLKQGYAKIKSARDADLGDVWTQRHEKESEFQQKKGEQRLREAYLFRHLGASGHNVELEAAAAAQDDHNRKLSLQLHRQKQLQEKKITGGTPPKAEDLAGKVVYVEEGVCLPRCSNNSIVALGLRKIQEIRPDDLPHIGVTDNPSAPRKDLNLIFRLVGGMLVRPEFLNGAMAGSVVTFAPAIHVERELWVSVRFPNNNPGVFDFLKRFAIDRDDSKWVLLDSLEMFELAKKRAIQKKKSSLVLGLATKPEIERIKQVMPAAMSKHVMEFDALLEFVTRFDMAASAIGWRTKANLGG